MALKELSFGRDWTNPADFPVYEESEQKVREDYQYHPNQIRDFLNTEVVGALNGRQGAANVGASDGKTVQDNLDKLVSDVQNLAGGTVPEQGSTLGWDLNAGGNKVVNLGIPSDAGDAMPLGYAISAALRAQFGVGDTASVAELLAWAMPSEYQWTLVSTLATPGSGTFTVPDLFDGEDYELGYYMIGGGGSGAAAAITLYGAAVGGGASGYGQYGVAAVSPGDKMPWTVGAGGAAVTVSSAGADGNAGGDTTFNGQTAKGGGGGRYKYVNSIGAFFPSTVVGNSGGQASDDILGVLYDAGRAYVPTRYGGTPPVDVASQLSVRTTEGTDYVYTFSGTAGKTFQPGRTGQNPFDPLMVTLGCGGYAAVGVYTSSDSILPPDTN